MRYFYFVFICLVPSSLYAQIEGCTDPDAFNCDTDSVSSDYIILQLADYNNGDPIYNAYDYSCGWSSSGISGTIDELEFTQDGQCSGGACDVGTYGTIGYYDPNATVDDGSCMYYQAPSADEITITPNEGSINVDWSAFVPPENASVEYYGLLRCDSTGCSYLGGGFSIFQQNCPCHLTETNFTDEYDWSIDSIVKYSLVVKYEQNPSPMMAQSASLVVSGCNDQDACNYGDFGFGLSCWYPNDDCTCSDDQGSVSDCAGECNGSSVIDDCGLCDGQNSSMDGCGICDGDSSTCTGCMDIDACNFDSNATISDNGTCTYPSTNYDCFGSCIAATDCAGVCGGDTTLDDCGVCGGSGPENNFDCDGNCNVGTDCSGACGGSAVTDVCGNCAGGIEVISECTEYGCTDETACNYNNIATIDSGDCIFPETNYDCAGNCIGDLDCTGACGGTAIIDSCGVCSGDGSTCTGCMDIVACNYDSNALIADSNSCFYTETNYDCAGNCINFDCSGVCGGDSVVDCAGICNGESFIDNSGDCTLSNLDYLTVDSFLILGSYPNPFNPSTLIRFQLPGISEISIETYNISGRMVLSRNLGNIGQGIHEYSFNGSMLPSGPYFIMLRSDFGYDSYPIYLLK